MAITEVELCGIKLKHPIMVAGGNLAENGEKARMTARAGAAAVVTKALGVGYRTKCNSPSFVCISREVDELHQSPTRHSTAGYDILGYSGWLSHTLVDWVEREFDIALEGGVPIILNVPGGRHQMPGDSLELWLKNLRTDLDYLLKLEKKGATAVELSLQTVQFDSPGSGVSAELMEKMITETKKVLSIPVSVKLPYLLDIDVWAKRAVKAGADALTLTGQARSIEIDPEGMRLAHPAVNGYTTLGGAATRPLTLYCVAQCIMKGVTVPLIANGGIWSGLDIIKFVMAGATAVQALSVINIEGLGAIRKLNSEVKDWLDSHGYKSLDEIRGAALDTWGENYREEFKAKVDPKRCYGCGLCVPLCRRAMRGAITLDETVGIVHIDKEKCTGCAYCTIVCPAGALSLDGWPPPKRKRRALA